MRNSTFCVRAALGMLCASALACTTVGVVEGDPEAAPGQPRRDPTTGQVLPPGGGGGGNGNGNGSALPPAAACKAINPGPSYVRRLTRREYDNTVRDLLGDGSGLGAGFPAEERVEGFDNNGLGQSVSPALLEQYLLAAERLATAAVEKSLVAIAGCDPATAMGGEDACAQRFLRGFGLKAFRRPPTADELTMLQGVYAAGKASGGFKGGVRLALTEMLMSPPFLYRVEVGRPPAPGERFVSLDHYEMAARLSYLLWGSMPDAALFAAAAAGKLGTRAEIAAEAQRMLGDPRAHDVTAHFYEQWLGLEGLDQVAKDPKAYPTFSASLLGAMRQETLQLAEELTWRSDGDFGALFTLPATFVSAALARFYGLPAPAGAGPGRVTLDGRRAGLLTQGALLTMLSHANQTSPVLRGKFVREALLCVHPPSPPNDVNVKVPELDPKLTTRERFRQHATDPSCAACHALMDPIGLGLENFDPVGLWRDTENGQTIDASGEVKGLSTDGRFTGAVELGRKLATSDEVRSCLATKWFQYGLGRAQEDADACSLAAVERRFAAGGYRLHDLLIALTETDAFLYRRSVAPGGVQ